MKTKILILILMSVFFWTNAYSQDETKKIKVSSISLSSGEGPLSNGLFLEANFSRGKDIINVSLGERDMYVVYLKAIGSKFNIGPSLEWFYNVPLLGIMSNETLIKIDKFTLSGMTWTGISAGKPEGKIELLHWRWLFLWQSMDISYKNLTATGAIIQFDGKWGPLVDFKYKQPLTPNFTLFGSAGYSWYKPSKALLKFGLIYEFK